MTTPRRPEQNVPERLPTGTGEDGSYVHDRAPTVDDTDDTDDEDGVLEQELERGSDLTPTIEPSAEAADNEAADAAQSPERASLGEEATGRDDLRREDKGAVNVEPEDLEG